MAIAAFFTAPLSPLSEVRVGSTASAGEQLAKELNEFFADKLDLHNETHKARGIGATSVDDPATGVQMAAASVAMGFANKSAAEARALAEQFTSENFPNIIIDIIDPAAAAPAP
ncbi:hypothetical protein [Mycobacteroides abscessus]|uniref:hypothetical protein n=1 Tax=Mycobacteroides abscessus TaxID=36809 RepID=UPI000C262CF0|nr:hypothetical protein [Mycobacteroides abscessus]